MNVTSLIGWNITDSSWINMQNNIQGIVFDQAWYNNTLYFVGNFTIVTSSNKIYRNFAAIQSNEYIDVIDCCNFAYGECEKQIITAIEINQKVTPDNSSNGFIFIGGQISTINNIVMNGISRLVNNKWTAFGTGLGGQDFIRVGTIQLTSDFQSLYIGGSFLSANSIPVKDIVSWSMNEKIFSPLNAVIGWSNLACIFDILPSIYNYSDQNQNSIDYHEYYNYNSPTNQIAEDIIDDTLAFGVICVLAAVCICLMIFVIVTLGYLVKARRPSPLTSQTSIENFADHDWDGKTFLFYFYM